MANTRVSRASDVFSEGRRSSGHPQSDAPPLQEPLAGYIFVCNAETMEDDLKRQLFGACPFASRPATPTSEGLWRDCQGSSASTDSVAGPACALLMGCVGWSRVCGAGLPQKHHDSVRNIQAGMPIFLYNYTVHQLHGVFEVSEGRERTCPTPRALGTALNAP